VQYVPGLVLLLGQLGVDELEVEHEHDDGLQQRERQALKMERISR
jgi:hypothetical protein